MKKFLVLGSLIAVILSFNLAANATDKVIESMSIKPAQIGTNYQQSQSFYVNKKTLDSFQIKFNANLLALKNDIFHSKDNRVQINYIEADSPAATEKVYKQMVDLVGHQNVVAQKGDVVIEVITPSTDTKKRIIELLHPTKVHTNY